MKALAIALSAVVIFGATSGATAAKRDANDPRRTCREALQKNVGQGKDYKVSRKAIERCVESGDKI